MKKFFTALFTGYNPVTAIALLCVIFIILICVIGGLFHLFEWIINLFSKEDIIFNNGILMLQTIAIYNCAIFMSTYFIIGILSFIIKPKVIFKELEKQYDDFRNESDIPISLLFILCSGIVFFNILFAYKFEAKNPYFYDINVYLLYPIFLLVIYGILFLRNILRNIMQIDNLNNKIEEIQSKLEDIQKNKTPE